MIEDIEQQRTEETQFLTSKRNIWFTDVNMELDEDKALLEKMGGKFFRKTASYGHFGRRDLELPWENVEEKAVQLAEASKVFL